MCVGGALQDLGAFLETCERRPGVHSIDLVRDGTSDAGSQVTAVFELALPAASAADSPGPFSLATTDLDDEGRLRLTFDSLDEVLPERPDGVHVEPTDATIDPDGGVSVTVTASTTVTAETAEAARPGSGTDEPDGGDPEPDRGPAERVSSTSSPVERNGGGRADSDESSDDDVPAFRNPGLLEEVYGSCETFAEMRDALEMDVTAETVRRYMISHGIHEPNSYDTSGAGGSETGSVAASGDPETPDVVADGFGLPEDVTVETLVDTVRRSDTVYELKTELGIDREAALEMLRQLDLVDHVVGRLATKDEREVSPEIVVERLRRQAAPQ